MRFDPSKASTTFQELGDPRFSGSEGETKIADFVAEAFARMGLHVERHAAVGSRSPQRWGPWIGWLGYGTLLTSVYLLLLRPGVLPSLLAFTLYYMSDHWLGAVVGQKLRPGHGREPLETAPVVFASTPDRHVAPVRVVFQAVLGGLSCDLFNFNRLTDSSRLCTRFATTFAVLAVLACKAGSFLKPTRGGELFPIAYARLMRYVCPGLLTIAWIAIAVVLYREYGRTRAKQASKWVDRRGLAVLLELARTWPRTGVRSIEPIFVAAGGQRLDHAGSREVIRLMGSEWADRPTLLLLLLAPGAGEKLVLFTFDDPFSELPELASSAARSLWIPVKDSEPFLSISPWPFPDCHPAVVLTGSDPEALANETVDPQALHRPSQLATEIALRWAKKQQEAARTTDSAT